MKVGHNLTYVDVKVRVGPLNRLNLNDFTYLRVKECRRDYNTKNELQINDLFLPYGLYVWL